LDRAVKAVPAVRYALGIGGVTAVIAIVFSFGINAKVAIFGTVIMLILMVVLVLFASLVRKRGANFSLPALIFTWFSLSLFMATSLLLFTSAFWAEPLDLRTFISAPKPISETSSASQEHPDQNNPVPQTMSPADQRTQHEQAKHAAVDQEAHAWELRGDKAAIMNIALESKGPEYAKSQEDLAKLDVALQAGFKQARTAWTNALNTAVTKQYKTALQTKLKGSIAGGLTCEAPDDDHIFCYSNGSEFDVIAEEGAPALTVKHISNKH
jgi:hypothetical protein